METYYDRNGKKINPGDIIYRIYKTHSGENRSTLRVEWNKDKTDLICIPMSLCSSEYVRSDYEVEIKN